MNVAKTYTAKTDNERTARIITGQMKFQQHQSGNVLRGMWIGYCCAVYWMGYENAQTALKRVERVSGIELPDYLPQHDTARINEIMRFALAGL